MTEVATVCRCIIKRNINSNTVGPFKNKSSILTQFQVLSLLEGPGALDPGVTSDCLDWIATHLAEVRGQPGWTEMLQKPGLAAQLLQKM